MHSRAHAPGHLQEYFNPVTSNYPLRRCLTLKDHQKRQKKLVRRCLDASDMTSTCQGLCWCLWLQQSGSSLSNRFACGQSWIDMFSFKNKRGGCMRSCAVAKCCFCWDLFIYHSRYPFQKFWNIDGKARAARTPSEILFLLGETLL